MNIRLAFCLIVISAIVPALADDAPNSPKKPIIRNFQNQTPLPGLSEPPRTKRIKKAVSKKSAQSTTINSPTLQPSIGTAGNPITGAVTVTKNGELPKRPMFHLNTPLSGGVTVNVPRTPEDVSKYLIKMKGIIMAYEQVAVGTLLGGANGGSISPDKLADAQQQALELVNAIHATVPPDELRNAHNQLATTLGEVGNFLQNPGSAKGGGFMALAQIGPIVSDLHSTMDRYHSGVTNCITYYKLSPSLDPFSGESEEQKQQLGDLIGNMKSSLFNQNNNQANSGDQQQGADPMSGLGDLMGAFGGGGGGMDMSSLTKMMSGQGGGSSGFGGGMGNTGFGGMDMESLTKMMSGLGGQGSGSTDTGGSGSQNLDANQLLQQLGGSSSP